MYNNVDKTPCSDVPNMVLPAIPSSYDCVDKFTQNGACPTCIYAPKASFVDVKDAQLINPECMAETTYSDGSRTVKSGTGPAIDSSISQCDLTCVVPPASNLSAKCVVSTCAKSTGKEHPVEVPFTCSEIPTTTQECTEDLAQYVEYTSSCAYKSDHIPNYIPIEGSADASQYCPPRFVEVPLCTQWRDIPFGACNSSGPTMKYCFTGTQTRDTVCEYISGEPTNDDSLCDDKSKPAPSQICSVVTECVAEEGKMLCNNANTPASTPFVCDTDSATVANVSLTSEDCVTDVSLIFKGCQNNGFTFETTNDVQTACGLPIPASPKTTVYYDTICSTAKWKVSGTCAEECGNSHYDNFKLTCVLPDQVEVLVRNCPISQPDQNCYSSAKCVWEKKDCSELVQCKKRESITEITVTQTEDFHIYDCIDNTASYCQGEPPQSSFTCPATELSLCFTEAIEWLSNGVCTLNGVCGSSGSEEHACYNTHHYVDGLKEIIPGTAVIVDPSSEKQCDGSQPSPSACTTESEISCQHNGQCIVDPSQEKEQFDQYICDCQSK